MAPEDELPIESQVPKPRRRTSGDRPGTRVGSRRSRLFDLRPGEAVPLLLSAAYFFLLLASYYVLRPVRDELAVAGGVRELPLLWTGTLVVTLAAHPLFALVATRMPRTRSIPLTYHVIAANLLLFAAAWFAAAEDQVVWLGRGFYVWVSAFNLFVVSVFWSFMADTFRPDQGARLFGVIAFGGTVGGIAGSGLTALLAERAPTAALLVVSAVLVEAAVGCVTLLARRVPASAEADGGREGGVGGPVLSGVGHVLRSPYLLGICLFLLLHTMAGTFAYFQQTEILGAAIADRGARTAFLARIDLAVNALTAVIQLLLTGRVLRVLGVGMTLGLLPLACVIGFSSLGAFPTLAVLAGFQIARRSANFALSRPARELLFTVLDREDKYKAKNLVDTFVYRTGDQLAAWSYAGLAAVGLAAGGLAAVAVLLSAGWLSLSLWLGRRQRSMVGRRIEDSRQPGTPTPSNGPDRW